ncbi:MAG: chromosomal replication initiator protein DnaA [Clostridiales bacterium]|nr:chromosomal replication initiator protein DnaA [Clostridiales bacterium]
MDNTADFLNRIREMLSEKFSEVTVNTWFGDADIPEISGDNIVLLLSSTFKKNIVLTKYREAFEDCVRELFSDDVPVYYMTDDEYKIFLTQKETTIDGEEGHTFENFVVGSSNRFAHAAASAVASKPASTYNPLFIYGPSGLGKTHLLNAIAESINKSKPIFKIVYITGEVFTNEIILAISEGKTQEFRQKYRQADLLLVDDVQFIAGRPSTQEEFFHTFNALYDSNKQIVLTSDRTPKEIDKLEDRLRTRFEWGLLADIAPPDFETRSAIIWKKAEGIQVDLTKDMVDYIATMITSNIRQLEGTVKKIKALNVLMDMPVDIETAKKAVEDIYRANPGLNPTPDYILSEASKYFSVSVQDIIGTRRSQDIMQARQVSIYLVRKLTKMSLPEIGGVFGGRDHTTILHSVNKVDEQITNQPDFQKKVEMLEKTIRG